MEQLRIFTFGELVIQRGQLAIKLATHKDEALLVYLAQTARAYPREFLAEMLWENRTLKQSLTNLRTSLTRLNKQLGDYLLVMRETAAFNFDTSCWFDFAQLTDALRQTETMKAVSGGLASAAANQLQLALDLYKGEFLAEFFTDSLSLEQWLLTCRESFRAGVITGHQVLVEHYEQTGLYTAALRQTQRLIELDPTGEAYHRTAMRLYTYLDQRRHALEQYDICCRVLNNELGIEPEAETKALHEQIHSGRLTIPERKAPVLFSLPAPRTPFIGRIEEINQIQQQFNTPECRLLTLMGPGGIGKSRLAVEAARALTTQFQDGAVFVSLQSVNSRDDMLYATANALGFVFFNAENKENQLLWYLSRKQLLILLDNFDHLLNHADLVSRILGSAPDVKVISTSRERLNLQEEWLISVGGLEMQDALLLFEQSARRVVPDFRLNGQQSHALTICEMGEGMPLAVELAASWVRVMPCAEIITQMQRSLDFLSTSLKNLAPHQRSIRALFDHSCDLLSADERNIFLKLAVLQGEWDSRAAEAIADASHALLISLVEKSLVRGSSTGRYSLHPLIRQYGLEKLAQNGALNESRRRHYEYFRLMTAKAFQTFAYGVHDDFYFRIRDALDNIQEALAWGLAHERTDEVLEMCCGTWYTWFKAGLWSEGYDWFLRALSADQRPTRNRGLALVYASQFSGLLLKVEASLAQHEEAVHIAETFNDLQIQSLIAQNATWNDHSYERGVAPFEEALALSRMVESPLEEGTNLLFYGDFVREHGDLAKAEQLYRQCLAVCTAANIVDHVAYAIGNLGRIALHRGDYETAREHFERTLALAREMNSPMTLADWLIRLGMTALYQGDIAQARAYLEENWQQRQKLGSDMGIADSLCCLADLDFHEGGFDTAMQRVTESLQLWIDMVRVKAFRYHQLLQGIAECLAVIGKLCAAQADAPKALAAFTLAEMIQQDVGFHFEPRIAEEMYRYRQSALDGLPVAEVHRIQTHIQQSGQFEWQGITVDVSQGLKTEQAVR
jgi:predicted ATPase/DNA-binding SARP family transcriptional activator